MPPWAIEQLGAQHDCAAFDCGKPVLTDWLKRFAGQHQKKDLARVYVLVARGQARVCGYYSISTCAIQYEALAESQAKGLPRKQIIPAALLGRLAVDRTVKGQGLGDVLLFDALKRVGGLSDQIAMRAVVVHALDEDAAGYYRHHQFDVFPDNPRHFFITTATIRKLFQEPAVAEAGDA